MNTTTLQILDPDEELEDGWTVTGDLRRTDEDEANYDVADELYSLYRNIEFDPEFSQFFAYAQSREQAEDLVRAIQKWEAQR